MITISESAQEKILDILAEENKPDLKLRIFVQGGGCSGMQYGFTLDEEQNEDDESCSNVVEDYTHKYIIENKRLKMLENDFDKLQTALRDKEKIIGLYEFMLNGNPPISTSRSVVTRMDA